MKSAQPRFPAPSKYDGLWGITAVCKQCYYAVHSDAQQLQRFCKPKVGSSILSTGTIDMSIDFNFFAQIQPRACWTRGDVESAPQEKARRLGRARRQIPHGGVVSIFTSGPPELILRQETPTVNRRAILHRSIPARYGFFRQSPTADSCHTWPHQQRRR